MANSLYLSRLSQEQLDDLRSKLHMTQARVCYICEDPIDLKLHAGSLDMDHIEPLVTGGRDADSNLALTHSSCNRSKGASDLRIARCLTKLHKLDDGSRERGEQGANLGDILTHFGGSTALFTVRELEGSVEYAFPQIGKPEIQSSPVYVDELSDLRYFFAKVPIAYIHHDDKINPRTIGSSIRGLLEEFLKKRPQLHVGLAWWKPDGNDQGVLKLFDGQHKAAAQLLLGIRDLPVRIFLDPPLDVLTQTNANAGSTLRQVAFDMGVMRNLGSTLYGDRIRQYREMLHLEDDDYSFSEDDLVRHFRAERRQMARYIVDAQRNRIARESSNKLFEFVEMSGRGTDRPMSYSTVNRAFFQFLLQKPLKTPIGQATERDLEYRQMIRLMNTFAETFFEGQWDSDVGGSRIESKVRDGESIPEGHLRAWRIAREEVTINVMRWVRAVIENYFALHGRVLDRDRLLLEEFPEPLWDSIQRFLSSLSSIPCWTNPALSSSVFGPKQNHDYWEAVFNTGKAPNGTQILVRGLNLHQMIAPEET